MMSLILLLMPRHRMSSSLRPINSKKVIIDSTLLSVAAGTISTVVLANAVDDFTGAPGTCPTGAKISSVYLFVQILPTASTENVDWYVAKSPQGIATATPGNTNVSTFRKYILHEEKGIPGNANDGAYPLTFKGVIRVPKGRQRMGEGDDIFIKLVGVGVYNACIKCIYKFYT